MTRLRMITWAAMGVGGLLLTPTSVLGQGVGPDPATIVQRHIANITFSANYCMAVNEKDSADCVIRVTNLLAKGQKTQAVRAALGSSRQIQRFASQTLRGIDRSSQVTIERVKDARDGDQLVSQIQAAHDLVTKKLQDSTTGAIGRIKAAVGS